MSDFPYLLVTVYQTKFMLNNGPSSHTQANSKDLDFIAPLWHFSSSHGDALVVFLHKQEVWNIFSIHHVVWPIYVYIGVTFQSNIHMNARIQGFWAEHCLEHHSICWHATFPFWNLVPSLHTHLAIHIILTKPYHKMQTTRIRRPNENLQLITETRHKCSGSNIYF